MKNFSRYKLNINWFACTIAATELLSSIALNATESQLLFYLLNKIDHNNRVKYENYNQIAEYLHVSHSSVKKAMMTLRDNNIITKDSNNPKTIFINPDLFHTSGRDSVNLEEKKDYYLKCQQEYKNKQSNRKNKLNKTMKKNNTKQGRKGVSINKSNNNVIIEKTTLDELINELNNE